MNRVILILDKMEKIDRATLVKELTELELSNTALKNVESYLDAAPTLSYFELFIEKKDFVKQGVAEIHELMGYLQALNIEATCAFNPFLARGLEIYTGTIYEMFLADGTIKSSIGNGGAMIMRLVD